MGKRQESRERIEAAIVEIGRRHLATEGAAGLSLRAVARDLGMVSSAVYRYVASRDELLTLLVVDAYTELADAVAAAVADVGAAGARWRSQIRAIAHATRNWALDQPARWALLYGSPVPGYHAPAERTVVPGTRVVVALFAAVARGIAEGDIPATEETVAQPLSGDFARLRAEFGLHVDDATMARCFALWAGLIGAVSLEVFGQYGADTLTDPRQLFDLQIDSLTGALTN